MSDIGGVLESRGLKRAIVVTGSNVGTNPDVMEPIRDGAGDRIAAVFDETTPAKRIETAYDGVEIMEEYDADAILAVGSGSSMDTARVMNILHGGFRDLDEIRSEIEDTGTIAVPDQQDLTPMILVPTTLPGADLTIFGATVVPMGDGETKEALPVSEHLMADALFYDPNLFETTPMSAMTGSAFNGLDKAIEMLYSRYQSPITDATAVRALQYFRDSFPELKDSDDPEVMDRAVIGIILAQYGWTTLPEVKLNIIHAFGHGLRNEWGIQQGIAHAIMAPHVLRLIFDLCDGRRDLLADGLVLEDSPEDPGKAVVEAVEEIRDSLELPTRLRDIEGTAEEGIPHAATLTHEDVFIQWGPEEFDPTVEEVEDVIRNAW